MYIVIVDIHVKPEKVSDFIAETMKNVKKSLQEDGILRFDFLQDKSDSSRFVLYEVYIHSDDQIKHRDSVHYNYWKEAVGDMMAEPRHGVKFLNISPSDLEWN
jgi:autoinducer 2-degrading protein